MGNTNGPMALSQASTPMKISDPMGRTVADSPPPPSPSWSTTENIFGTLLSRGDTGTLKRLTKKLKTKLGKSGNHSQVFREFANLLSIRELAYIYEEYKSTFFLKELFLHAQNARQVASNVRNDLLKLYESQVNTDITLVYQSVEFPVHKAIVCARCPYFRELLSKKVPGTVVTVDLEINELTVELFNDLLKFLYTGELTISYDSKSNKSSYKTLMRISQECGVPNALPNDLKHLFETGIYSDASLCFQFSNNGMLSHKRCLCVKQTEFACHQAILASRSPFFRSIIERQLLRNNTSKNDRLNQRMKIILDEDVVPRRYAKVILHIMYRDSEDFSSIAQSSACKCSSTKDNQQMIISKEMMDLYEIASFLELESLINATENLIVEMLTPETLIPILKWSSKSHGSSWVERQAMAFLRDEFSSISSNISLLSQLEECHLTEVLKSDFIETSELELFKCIVKWGEQKIAEDSVEPNLISGHTLTRRTLRKKEIDDSKLADVISPLVPLIRVGHILPIDCEFLQNAVKRELIKTLPPFMQTDSSCPSSRNYSAWFRNRSQEFFVRPRLFMVYFEECKAVLEHRLGYRISTNDDNDEDDDEEGTEFDGEDDGTSSVTNSSRKDVQNIPDTLYMVNNLNGTGSVISDGDLRSPTSPMEKFHFCFTSSSTSSVNGGCQNEVENDDEVITDSEPLNLPVIEESVLTAMRQREKELRASPFCLRVLKIFHNRCQALRYIQLRVIREFGLPDSACEVLNHRQPLKNPPVKNSDSNSEVLSQHRVIPPPLPPFYPPSLRSSQHSKPSSQASPSLSRTLERKKPSIPLPLPPSSCVPSQSPIPFPLSSVPSSSTSITQSVVHKNPSIPLSPSPLSLPQSSSTPLFSSPIPSSSSSPITVPSSLQSSVPETSASTSTSHQSISTKALRPPIPPPRPSKRKVRPVLPESSCDPFSLQSELKLEAELTTH